MDRITLNDLAPLFASVAQVMARNAELLGEMDARMGDGDLGLTMKKGFASLPPLLREMDAPDMGKRLAHAGMKMSSVVPSTMGTLMASGMLTGGKALMGRAELGPAELAAFLQGFADGIVKRGKCAPGDRTVLDALQPAADAARDAAGSGASLPDTARAALEGARSGVEATKSMRPKFGKAAVFADKAQGTPDQGACAGMFLVEGLAEYLCR